LDWAVLLRRTFRAGRVRVREVWGQAPGIGVPDSTRWGACHLGTPGTAHAACSAGPGAGATAERIVLSPKQQLPIAQAPRRTRAGSAACVGVRPKELHSLSGTRLRPSSAPLHLLITLNSAPTHLMLAQQARFDAEGSIGPGSRRPRRGRAQCKSWIGPSPSRAALD
jgi:hypothetical protein